MSLLAKLFFRAGEQIASMAGVQFLVPVDDVGTRLSVSLSLVLTAAAYKIVANDMVPKLAYLTVLDKYVMSCSFFIVIMVFEGAAVGQLAKHPEWHAERIDDVMAFILGLWFILLHVWFCYRAKKRDFSSMTDEQQQLRREYSRVPDESAVLRGSSRSI